MAKKIVLTKEASSDITIETHFEPPKNFSVVLKNGEAKVKEALEYVGHNPIEAARVMAETVAVKIRNGYSISQDRSYDSPDAGYGTISKEPKKLAQLCGFLSAEALRTLEEEGYDVGDWSEAKINFSGAIGEPKKLNKMNIEIVFKRTGEGVKKDE